MYKRSIYRCALIRANVNQSNNVIDASAVGTKIPTLVVPGAAAAVVSDYDGGSLIDIDRIPNRGVIDNAFALIPSGYLQLGTIWHTREGGGYIH